MNETQNNRHSALRRLLTLLIPGLQAQWMRVTTAFVCLFLSVGLRILEPWPLQHVLDSVIAEIGRPNQNLSADATGPFRSTGTLLIVCADMGIHKPKRQHIKMPGINFNFMLKGSCYGATN